MNYTKGEHGTDKEVGSMDCGCIIFERTSTMWNETRTFIQYCPKHSAAPMMYEALKAILPYAEYLRHSLQGEGGLTEEKFTKDMLNAYAALSKAEGE